MTVNLLLPQHVHGPNVNIFGHTMKWLWNREFSKTVRLTQRNKDADSADTLKFYCLFATSAALRFTFNVSLLNDLQVYSYTEIKGFIINLSLCAIVYSAFFSAVNIIEKCFACDRDKC